MKTILLSVILLVSGSVMSQPACPIEPCSHYLPYDACCTGQLRTYSGNQCLSGPGVIDTSVFTNFNFLSLKNLQVKSTIDFTTGIKKLYTNTVTVDSISLDANDTIIKLFGPLVITKLRFSGTGTAAILLPTGDSVLISGTNYFPGQSYGQVDVIECRRQILALPSITRTPFRPTIVYRFTITQFNGGKPLVIKDTYQNMMKRLPFSDYPYLVESGGTQVKVRKIK